MKVYVFSIGPNPECYTTMHAARRRAAEWLRHARENSWVLRVIVMNPGECWEVQCDGYTDVATIRECWVQE